MDTVAKIRHVIENKPLFFQAVTLAYLALVIMMKWQIHLTLFTVYFLLGGILGIYLIDLAEAFMDVRPSPFRSWVFCYGFIAVSLFIITSSGSYLAGGLVLSMYVTLLLWMGGQLHLAANIDDWYRMMRGPADRRTQGLQYAAFMLIFIIESILFVRQLPS